MTSNYGLDEKKILKKIKSLADLGRDGNFGTTRLLYTAPWFKAQELLAAWMNDAGLVVKKDAGGNLFGKLVGENNTSTILTGSHMDTVIGGGAYDGALGIIAGIEALKLLESRYGKPQKSLEVVAISDEEGTRFKSSFFGSKVINGLIDLNTLKKMIDDEGISLISASGVKALKNKDLVDAYRKDLAAYIELHVEQGSILEAKKLPIGIISTITGQTQLKVTVRGLANHAGTTGIENRKDALVTAAEMIISINKLAREVGDPAVATVGKIIAEPNVRNVIPGKVVFSIDIRHPDEQIGKKLVSNITSSCKEISEKNQLASEVKILSYQAPVEMHQEIIHTIQEAALEMQVPFQKIISGAGHDAQIFAGKVKTGMIFVPSVSGISHNPLEFTKLEDIILGIELLTKVLYKLAY